MTQETTAIGKALVAIRVQRNMSQVEFAKLTGLNPSIIAMVEVGKRDLSHKNVMKIFAYLGSFEERFSFFNAYIGQTNMIKECVFNSCDLRDFLLSVALMGEPITEKEFTWLLKQQKNFPLVLAPETCAALVREYKRRV